MSEIQLHAHRNKNKPKSINLTANKCENFYARKFNFVKFAVKYSYINTLNGCVDSTILTKPNVFVTVNTANNRDFNKLGPWQLKYQEDAKHFSTNESIKMTSVCPPGGGSQGNLPFQADIEDKTIRCNRLKECKKLHTHINWNGCNFQAQRINLTANNRVNCNFRNTTACA